MTDPISSIQRVAGGQVSKPVDLPVNPTGAAAPAASPNAIDAKALKQAQPAAPAHVDPAEKKPAEQKAAAEAQKKKLLPVSSLDSVMIRFSVDDKTKNITVYVIDKVSRRVVRAIPPEDLNKMQAGDLLQLLA